MLTSRLARLVTLAAVAVVLVVVLFVVNQTVQVVSLASAVHPWLGRGVLLLLLLVYAAAVLVPLVALLRLPRALVPPAAGDAAARHAHLQSLGQRLALNPHLAGRPPPGADPDAIAAALVVLDARARELVTATARTVFAATAVSQSGRLDGLVVLGAQARLVWRLARLYHQRPAPAELVRLYANIGAAVFVATELEDLDLGEQVEAVVGGIVAGSAAGLVPGLSLAASVLTRSILDGAANAYLTLRVGVLCQRYCGALAAVDRRAARRAASAEAARLLAGVVRDSAAVVGAAVVQAAKRAGSGAAGSAVDRVRRLGDRLNPFPRGPGEPAP